MHRGVYAIAEEATRLFEAARHRGPVHRRPRSGTEIVFTKNATEGLNLVAHAWGRANLQAGDTIVLTEMEHHANLVPWQMLAERAGIELQMDPGGRQVNLVLDDLTALVDGAKLVG